MGRVRHILPLALLGLLIGCDWTEMQPVEQQVVVEAYLQANRSLPPIHLTRTASIDGVYQPDQLGIDDAEVEVHRLAADGSVAERYTYENRPGNGGRYVIRPATPDVVFPGATYALSVRLSDGTAVRASTIVPDTMSVLNLSAETATFEGERVEITLTRSFYPGRPTYLVFTTEALEASEENATAVTRRLLEEADDLSVAELRVTSSFAISEATYVTDAGDALVIPVPWIGIRFYGHQRIQVSAVDDNLYDFLRSQLVQQGGSTFLPGEVPNILDHVEGGTGLFGSYAATQVSITVLRPEDDP